MNKHHKIVLEICIYIYLRHIASVYPHEKDGGEIAGRKRERERLFPICWFNYKMYSTTMTARAVPGLKPGAENSMPSSLCVAGTQ